jgi:hypothetical protein
MMPKAGNSGTLKVSIRSLEKNKYISMNVSSLVYEVFGGGYEKWSQVVANKDKNRTNNYYDLNGDKGNLILLTKQEFEDYYYPSFPVFYDKKEYVDNTLLYNIKTAPIHFEELGENLDCPVWRPTERFMLCSDFPWYLIGNYGTIYDMKRRVKVRPRLNSSGYLDANYRDYNGDPKETLHIQRTVLQAHDPIEDDSNMQANHLNKDTIFNYYNPYDPRNNLKWTTGEENFDHAVETDHIRQTGRYVGWRIYTADEVRMLCRMVIDGKSYQDMSMALGGVDLIKLKDYIRSLRNGRTRKEVTKEFLPLPYALTKENATVMHNVCNLIARGFDKKNINAMVFAQSHRNISSEALSAIRYRHPNFKIWFSVIDQYDFSRASF